ncbi:hypothetical protein TPHA_0K00910 [Tetrapisispora phaffii CBS 4417]|uniref:Uncharacterized protein n=1 Tax=Tetrapisispora phaffii (strain ATCC 24235 / CBS 4417 / NBRC 1672 / NRRL Y-8282 / UCD 70-5) TaxID=1071381 RepID=G8BZ97_TETPH|nr:hypothetical protein TPHA_0K00910 [Tetrapisispora phaffii CBS 4417]CCE65225.1 hypothetical protein TPHA_0K00910 [Tetrapisispora phaffii CBS 4417]
MSRASKITLGVTCLLTAITIATVHIVQEVERETLHQGPIKDAKRVAEKRLQKEQDQTRLDAEAAEKARKREFNKNDHAYQQELRKKYEAIQPLSGEVVTAESDK